MKKRWIWLMPVCILLLAACAGLAASEPLPLADLPEAQPVEVEYEKPEYEMTPFVYGNQFCSEDEAQETLAVYNYQIVLLALINEDAVSPADAEAAERNIETFNSKMRAVGEELVEQGKAMAADALEAYNEFGSLAQEYEDGAAMEAGFSGEIVSVCMYRENYTGGAHPNRYAVSYMFDLEAGQFIDPLQLADDPEVFRRDAAALLMEQADAWADSFWEDYAEVIERWNVGTVQFTDEGMKVIYSPYVLGPYSMGEVELLLTWEEIAPLVGPGGMERLGREAAE